MWQDPKDPVILRVSMLIHVRSANPSWDRQFCIILLLKSMVSNSYSLGMPTGNKRIPKPRISGNDGLHRGNHYLLVIQCIYIYTTYILLCNTAHLVEWFAIESGDFQRVAMFSNSLTYGSIYRSEIGNINPLHAFLGVLISISLFHFVECGWMLWPYGQLNMVGTQNGRSITVAPLILLDYSYLIFIYIYGSRP